MGTNYYWITDPCESCGKYSDKIHIGKSSSGWCFLLCVHPEKNIMSFDDWKKYWKENSQYGCITNEYGDYLSFDLMSSIISDRTKYCSPNKSPLRHIELQNHYGKNKVWFGDGDWDYCIDDDKLLYW